MPLRPQWAPSLVGPGGSQNHLIVISIALAELSGLRCQRPDLRGVSGGYHPFWGQSGPQDD